MREYAVASIVVATLGQMVREATIAPATWRTLLHLRVCSSDHCQWVEKELQTFAPSLTAVVDLLRWARLRGGVQAELDLIDFVTACASADGTRVIAGGFASDGVR
jgi:hypothetical protein